MTACKILQRVILYYMRTHITQLTIFCIHALLCIQSYTPCMLSYSACHLYTALMQSYTECTVIHRMLSQLLHAKSCIVYSAMHCSNECSHKLHACYHIVDLQSYMYIAYQSCIACWPYMACAVIYCMISYTGCSHILYAVIY